VALGALLTQQWLVTGRPFIVTGVENEAEEQAADRGVRYRVVVERSVLDLPDGITELLQTWRCCPCCSPG
jgi:hypothetical protein